MKKILLVSILMLGMIFIGTTQIGAKMNNNVTQVRALHILVDSKQEASDIKKQIDSNEISFEEAAKKYSKCPSKKYGGDLGYFGRGAMVKEFEKAAFDSPTGAVTNPVETQFGWHLIKVVDKK